MRPVGTTSSSSDGSNPWLAGNFAPVTGEVTVDELVVRGHLPEVLEGRFLRIGPNPMGEVEDPAHHHWFIGDGMVHGVRLGGGEAAWYRNRWVRTDRVAAALGEQPVEGPRSPVFDSSNTALLAMDGTAFSLTEMCYPYELDEHLGTVRRTDFGGPMPNGFTAHPKVDPATGEVHGFGYGLDQPHLVYVAISPDGQVTRNEAVELAGPASVHDFAITAEHLVFPDLPVVFSMDLVAEGYRFPFGWDDDYPSRLGVVPRAGHGADVRWFEVEPCYVFHVLNAYDVHGEGGEAEAIVLDVVRYERVFQRDLLGPSDVPGTLERFTLDLGRGTVQQERLDDRPQEFPRADPRLTGRPHRYGYSLQLGEGDFFASVPALLKHDLHTGAVEAHRLGAGRFGSEAVFVPDGPDADEDDGWLVSFVYDTDRGASDLVVVSTQDMTGPPAAVVELPVRVPFGFHGCWVPDT